jgi:hypothetical protein
MKLKNIFARFVLKGLSMQALVNVSHARGISVLF